MPFAVFLKKYFAANKKYGSKDRKQIASLCYNFYRLGKAIPELPVEEKIIAASFLCEEVANDFLHFHKPEWNEIITTPVADKLKILGFAVNDIFPWADELSDGIGFELFCKSFFIQPDLFVRIRPGNKDAVVKKLQDAALQFSMLNEDCLVLPNATRLDEILNTGNEVIIQDYNSQQVLNFLKGETSFLETLVPV